MRKNVAQYPVATSSDNEEQPHCKKSKTFVLGGREIGGALVQSHGDGVCAPQGLGQKLEFSLSNLNEFREYRRGISFRVGTEQRKKLSPLRTGDFSFGPPKVDSITPGT